MQLLPCFLCLLLGCLALAQSDPTILPPPSLLSPRAPPYHTLHSDLQPKFYSHQCNINAKLFWSSVTPIKPTRFVLYRRVMGVQGGQWEEIEVTPPYTEPEAPLVLWPNTQYEFKVCQMWTDQEGLLHSSANSSVVGCRSKPSPPLEQPRFVSAYHEFNSDSILVVWEPLKRVHFGHDSLQYLVSYTANQRETLRPRWSRTLLVQNGSLHSVSIESVHAFVPYWIKIEALNKIGPCEKEAIVHEANQREGRPQSPPSDLHVLSITTYPPAVTLQWQPVSAESVQGNFRGYRIYLNRSGSNFRQEQLIRENVSLFTLNDLRPGTNYTASILTLNGPNQSDPSPPIHFSTQPNPIPEKPGMRFTFECEPNHIHQSDPIIRVYFEASLSPNQSTGESMDATHYRIEYCLQPAQSLSCSVLSTDSISVNEEENSVPLSLEPDQLSGTIRIRPLAIQANWSRAGEWQVTPLSPDLFPAACHLSSPSSTAPPPSPTTTQAESDSSTSLDQSLLYNQVEIEPMIPEDESDSSSASSQLVVILLTVAAILFVTLLLAVFIFQRKKRGSSQLEMRPSPKLNHYSTTPTRSPDEEEEEEGDGVYAQLQPTTTTTRQPTTNGGPISYSDLEEGATSSPYRTST